MKWLRSLIVAACCLAPVGTGAWWQSIQQVSVGSSGPATLTYQSFATEASGSLNITYSGISWGTAASNRLLVAVLCVRASIASAAPAITSVTFGATSGTQVPSAAATNAALVYMSDIWYASVPSGTSGNVAIVVGGTTVATTRTGIQLYSVNTSTASPSNANNAAAQAASLNASLTVPSNGVGVASFCARDSGSVISWTNATADNSSNLSGSTAPFGVAHTTSAGAISITGQTDTGASDKVLSLASWGP